MDTNILKVGGWYYAAYSWAWPPHCGHGKGQQPRLVPDATGPMRTGNILDPSSWRGWDGKDFTVTLVDPYRGPVDHPQAHVCAPVPFLDYANGTNFHEAFSSLRRDAMEPGLGRLWAIGRVFHHVGGLYPLEQAGTRNHAQPDVATRARRKLVLHVLFPHRSEREGFQLCDDQGSSLFVLRAAGLQPWSLSTGLVSAEGQVGWVGKSISG